MSINTIQIITHGEISIARMNTEEANSFFFAIFTQILELYREDRKNENDTHPNG